MLVQRVSFLFIGALVVSTCSGATSSSATTDALVLERKIPLGDVAGRIDHLGIDLARHRLFVAELGNNTVGVVDYEAGRVVHRITGFREPQGVGYVASSDTIYVANAGDGTLHRYRGADFSPLGTLKLGDDADNIRVDADANQVVVGYGGGALATLDAASGKKISAVSLAAHPESFQLEPGGARAFVNVPDARQVAVVDRAASKQIGAWKMDEAAANFPMALDGNRLVVAYRKPPLLGVFDTSSGKVVTRLPTCGDADDVFVDAGRKRIYVSCGEGALAVLQREGDDFRELGRIPTVSGARTSFWSPDLDRLFLAVRARGREPAAVWVYRPAT
jgi:hypothetical protein